MKWEYKTVTDYNSPIYDWELNSMGNEGWELVSRIVKRDGEENLLFKRPKE